MTRWMVLLLAACSGSSDPEVPPDAHAASPAQIVVMVNGDGSPPGELAASDLFVMNLDGSGREQITHDPELEFLPHFSPDGTKLLYSKYLTGTYGVPDAIIDVFAYDFATRQETRLTTKQDAVQGVWSPDGRTIAFLTVNTAIWLMDADGSNQRVIASTSHADLDGQWGDLAWSSDNWLLFSVAQQPTGPCFKVRLDKMRPDGSERTQVTDGGPSCTPTGMEQSGDADPGFSPDGRTIEHDLKRAHLALLVKLKNALTPAQQAKLRTFKSK